MFYVLRVRCMRRERGAVEIDAFCLNSGPPIQRGKAISYQFSENGKRYPSGIKRTELL